jgi:hypothetical protein
VYQFVMEGMDLVTWMTREQSIRRVTGSMTNTGSTDVAVQVLKQLKRASQQRACALGIASQLDLAQPPSALSVPC